MSQPLIMSFRPDAAQMCIDGRKRQTRRIYRPEWYITGSDPVEVFTQTAWGAKRSRLTWRVGETIAIKPSRTAKALGRVMCTGLRVEHAQAWRRGRRHRLHTSQDGHTPWPPASRFRRRSSMTFARFRSFRHAHRRSSTGLRSLQRGMMCS